MLPNVDFNTMSYEHGRQLIVQPALDKQAAPGFLADIMSGVQSAGGDRGGGGIMDSITAAKDAIVAWLKENPQVMRYGAAGLGGGTLGALTSLGQDKKDRTPFTRALTGAGMGMGGLALYDLLQDAREDSAASGPDEAKQLELQENVSAAEGDVARDTVPTGTPGVRDPQDPQDVRDQIFDPAAFPDDTAQGLGKSPGGLWAGGLWNEFRHGDEPWYVDRTQPLDWTVPAYGAGGGVAASQLMRNPLRGKNPFSPYNRAEMAAQKLTGSGPGSLDPAVGKELNQDIRRQTRAQRQRAAARPFWSGTVGRAVYGNPTARTLSGRTSPGFKPVSPVSPYAAAVRQHRFPGGRKTRGGVAGAAALASAFLRQLQLESRPGVQTNALQRAAQQAVNRSNTAQNLLQDYTKQP
jgi:hypothetical protein